MFGRAELVKRRETPGARLVQLALMIHFSLLALSFGPGCGPDDLPAGVLPGALVSYAPARSTTSSGTSVRTTVTTAAGLVPLEPSPSPLSTVLVASVPSKFTSPELDLIRGALRGLPDQFLRTVEIHRDLNPGSDPKLGELAAQARQSDDGSRSIITFFRAWIEAPNGDFPPEIYTLDEAATLFARKVVNHEFTHHAQARKPDGTVSYLISFENNTALTRDWASQFGWTLKPDNVNWAFEQSRCAERPSSYAVQVNPFEDQAESVGFYFTDGPRLRSASFDRNSFVSGRLQLPIVADPAKTTPPDRVRFGPQCPPSVAQKQGGRLAYCRVIHPDLPQ